MRYFAIMLAVLAFYACSSGQNGTSEAKMPEKAKILYNKTEVKIRDLEERVNRLDKEIDAKMIVAVLIDAKKLNYDFNPDGMNSLAVEKCLALQKKAKEVQKVAIAKAEDYMMKCNVQVYKGEGVLLEKMEEYPVYLEKGDKLYYKIELQDVVPVRLYNADAGRTLKTYNTAFVNDSLLVANSGIYLLEINTKSPQYASIDIAYHTDNKDRIYNPKAVRAEAVSCAKGGFRAYPVKGVRLAQVYDSPKKFTLKGQFKAAFSGGGDIALVPVKVPAGATDILYSMRIATSESDKYSDGKFHDGLASTYKKVKFLGLPLYEKTKSGGNGLISTLLDDNRPLREEDAYCNMYVFRNQSQAKQFQDGTKMASELNYDVDWSTVGTQSCNGRIPVNGAKTIYLAFQNERVRYTNYLWVEVEAVVPQTEYYRTKYSIE